MRTKLLCRAAFFDDALRVAQTYLLTNIQPHLRELDRNVRVDAGVFDASEHAQVFAHFRIRLGLG